LLDFWVGFDFVSGFVSSVYASFSELESLKLKFHVPAHQNQVLGTQVATVKLSPRDLRY